MPKLALGMPAYFTTLGQPDRRRTGTLRQILPTPEVVNNVVLYSALFDVENPTHDLLPQMSAQVFFVVGQVGDVPVVPMSALKPVPRTPGRYVARILGVDGPADRQIDIGVTDRVVGEVKSGLAVGEEIVTESGSAARGQSGLFRMLRL